ncbi:MAG: abortive infection family protein [Planctomycetaceae bacterium]
MTAHTPSLTQHRTITEVTRRDIRRALLREGIWWSGDLPETDFLNRLYDLSALPSNDYRFETAEGDIYQHRILNPHDWDDTWIFTDERFQLADGPDELFLNFLAEMVHPMVQPDREFAKKVVVMLNALLAPDGCELVERSTISGRSIYGPRLLTSSQHALRSTKKLAEQVDSDYIHRQVNRMESAIESDPDLAIGTAKELVETMCHTILEFCGAPVMDRPDLLPLARRALEELKLVPDGIKDEIKGAKSVKAILGNLATLVQGLAEIRNLYGTGHGKGSSTKGLSPRHARLAVGAATTLAVFLFDTHDDRKGQK